jgi:hypothetical protein
MPMLRAESPGNYKGGRMKKSALVLSILTIITVFTSSRLLTGETGKYADLKDLLIQSTKLNYEFVAACQKIKDAGDFIRILDDFRNGMKKLAPMMKAMEKKYKDLDESNFPKKLKTELENARVSGQKWSNAYVTAAAKFMNDPDVKKAMAALEKVGKDMAEGKRTADDEKEKK